MKPNDSGVLSKEKKSKEKKSITSSSSSTSSSDVDGVGVSSITSRGQSPLLLHHRMTQTASFLVDVTETLRFTAFRSE